MIPIILSSLVNLLYREGTGLFSQALKSLMFRDGAKNATSTEVSGP